MPPAPLPDNDAERLAALRALLILDTPPEQRFDRIVRFAAEQFDAPMASLSLVDEKRLWFKARVGLEVCEVDRDLSFCAHAIHRDEVMVVPDAALDPRFAGNPLVTGGPRIRFYAGAPLAVKPGLRVGTLCIFDRQPRELDATELRVLATLRDLVRGELLGQSDLEP